MYQKLQLLLNKIIAISGLKNSGKSEAAKMVDYILNSPPIFRNWFSYKYIPKIYRKYETVAFAGTLKKMLADFLGFDYKRFEDRDFKENTYIDLSTLHIAKDPTKLNDRLFNKLLKQEDSLKDQTLSIRQIMQYFGTEICQKYFGKEVWINTTLNSSKNLIISDLRFKTEAEAVKKRNGFLIFISRQGTEVGNHASEKEVIDLLNDRKFDLVIRNDEDLKSLFYKLKDGLCTLLV